MAIAHNTVDKQYTNILTSYIGHLLALTSFVWNQSSTRGR